MDALLTQQQLSDGTAITSSALSNEIHGENSAVVGVAAGAAAGKSILPADDALAELNLQNLTLSSKEDDEQPRQDPADPWAVLDPDIDEGYKRLDGERARLMRVDQLACLQMPDGFDEDEDYRFFHLQQRFPNHIQKPHQSQHGDPGYIDQDEPFPVTSYIMAMADPHAADDTYEKLLEGGESSVPSSRLQGEAQ